MNELNQILFERYLTGVMRDSERRDFDKRLETDKEFKEDFEVFHAMQVFLQKKVEHGSALESLRKLADNKRRSVQGNIYNVKTGKRNVIRMNAILQYAVAAVFLVLIGYIGIKLFRDTQGKPSFSEVYEPPVWPGARGEEGQLAEFIGLYDSGQKSAALDSLKTSILIEDRDRYYWLTELFLIQENIDSTQSYLNLCDKSSRRRDRLNFIQALVFLHQNEKNKLKDFISNLPEDTDPYYRSKLNDIID